MMIASFPGLVPIFRRIMYVMQHNLGRTTGREGGEEGRNKKEGEGLGTKLSFDMHVDC